MRRLNQVYTQAFNRRHGRVGPVLLGRYKAIVVDKDNYLLELCRYIVLNPVRAGWLLRRTANLSLKDTADVFGVSPSRISHIKRMIESRRLTQRERKSCELCNIKQ